MTFVPKSWADNPPSSATKVDAAALIDLETRLSDYSDALGLSILSGAGPVIVGSLTLVNAGTLFEVVSPSGVTTPDIASISGATAATGLSLRVGNTGGSTAVFVAGATNDFLTGTAQSDTGIRFSATKQFHIGRDSGRAQLRISDNIGIGPQADSFGGGTGVMFLSNITVAPTSLPTNGSLLYAHSGVLKSNGGAEFGAAITGITAGIRVTYSGTSHAVVFNRVAGNPASGTVLTVTAGDLGTDVLDMDTTLGVSGYELGHGTIKVTHNKPVALTTVTDANASAISIRCNGTNTAAQAIFFDAEDTGYTGKILNLRNFGVEQMVLTANGQLQLATQGQSGTSGGIIVGGDCNLYRGAANEWRTNDQITSIAASGTAVAFSATVSGASPARSIWRGDGQIEWGDGLVTRDVLLLRRAADVLNTPDTFEAGGGFRVNATAYDYTGTKALVNGGSGGRNEVGLHVKEAATGMIVSHSNTQHFISLNSQDGSGIPFMGFMARHSTATTNMAANGAGAHRGIIVYHDNATNASLVVAANQSATASADFTTANTLMEAKWCGPVRFQLGMGTKVKAGLPVDADWTVAPADGTMVLDSTKGKLNVRSGSAWLNDDAFYQPQWDRLLSPFEPSSFTSFTTSAINQARFARVVVPRDGDIRDLSWFVSGTTGTPIGGNYKFVVYDCGAATSGTYTRLYASASTATVLTNGTNGLWNTVDPGAAAIPVKQGQHLMLGVAFDNAQNSMARSQVGDTNMGQLPTTSYFGAVGGMSPKLGAAAVTIFVTPPATITELNMVTSNSVPLIIARIA